MQGSMWDTDECRVNSDNYWTNHSRINSTQVNLRVTVVPFHPLKTTVCQVPTNWAEVISWIKYMCLLVDGVTSSFQSKKALWNLPQYCALILRGFSVTRKIFLWKGSLNRTLFLTITYFVIWLISSQAYRTTIKRVRSSQRPRSESAVPL